MFGPRTEAELYVEGIPTSDGNLTQCMCVSDWLCLTSDSGPSGI